MSHLIRLSVRAMTSPAPPSTTPAGKILTPIEMLPSKPGGTTDALHFKKKDSKTLTSQSPKERDGSETMSEGEEDSKHAERRRKRGKAPLCGADACWSVALEQFLGEALRKGMLGASELSSVSLVLAAAGPQTFAMIGGRSVASSIAVATSLAKVLVDSLDSLVQLALTVGAVQTNKPWKFAAVALSRCSKAQARLKQRLVVNPDLALADESFWNIALALAADDPFSAFFAAAKGNVLLMDAIISLLFVSPEMQPHLVQALEVSRSSSLAANLSAVALQQEMVQVPLAIEVAMVDALGSVPDTDAPFHADGGQDARGGQNDLVNLPRSG